MNFCDLDCKYAQLPKCDAVDGSRSCRTFVALHGKLKKKLVHKNLPCNEKREKKIRNEELKPCFAHTLHLRFCTPCIRGQRS